MGLNDYGNRLVSDQVQFKFDQRFGTALTLRSSYTYAKVYTFNSPSIDKANLDADWGPAANDVRHRFVMSSVARLPLGRAVRRRSSRRSSAAALQHHHRARHQRRSRHQRAAARAAARWSRRSRGGATASSAPTCASARPSGLGAERKIEVLWEMFNLFNTVNFGNYDNNMRSTRFGQPRFAAAPFQGQLGLRFDF